MASNNGTHEQVEATVWANVDSDTLHTSLFIPVALTDLHKRCV